MLHNINNVQAILAEGMLRKDVNPLDLLVFAARDEKYDGDYRAAVMQFSDLIDDLGGLTTVAVDGVTITGDGTVGNPLEVQFPAPTVPIVKASFAQGDFAAQPEVVALPLGGIVIVTDYNASGNGGSFVRVDDTNDSYLDFVVLASENTASTGLFGANPA